MPRFGIRSLFIFVAMAAVACFAYVQLVVPAKEAARSMSCRNNLRQIALGLLNYESTFRSLPPAIEVSPTGEPWRSWRSYIYPTFMEQSPVVYDSTSSWDSPANIRLLNGTPIPMSDKSGNVRMLVMDRSPWVFCCPSFQARGGTGIDYVVVTGEFTAFPKSGCVKLSDITDGLENTILVVESSSCTPDWTEPRDLDFETMSFHISSNGTGGVSSHHPAGPWVCFADGEVYRLTEEVTASELKAMLTINGDEGVLRRDLISRGVIIDH